MGNVSKLWWSWATVVVGLLSAAALGQGAPAAVVSAPAAPAPAASATPSARVPQAHVPTTIALELTLLERAFESALSRDCAPERCFAKGCFYGRHQTVDQPRGTSLPGLPADEGVGSVPTQDYLTEARCEFTHERSVAARDVQALVRRLESRLSRGYRRVVVVPQALEPINASLAEPSSPPPEDDKAQAVNDEAAADDAAAAAAVPEPEWSGGVAFRELWQTLLPHAPWMVAILLLTLATGALIWAGRRLGAKTIDEKVLESQLATPEPAAPTPAVDAQPHADKELEEERSFSEQQERLWLDRMAHVEDNQEGPMVELLREWLKVGDFPMLARAVFIFGDRLSKAFANDPELSLKKIEFAEYFRDVEESSLPSRSEFFRRLNQNAMASMLMSQSDVQLYRALREDFGSGGVLALMEELPHRFGALLFALVPRDTQQDVARMMPLERRVAVAEQLLASTRISKEESAYVFSCISAAREGQALPKPPKAVVTDRGPSVDAASAVSVLLPYLSTEQRHALFDRALHGAGNAPQWYEDIFYGEMLMRLEPEQRSELLLDVDVRGLAGWLSQQDLEWQRGFVSGLSPAMQKALHVNGQFPSRADQVREARRGHHDIIRALKGLYSKGRVSFVQLAA